MKHAATRSDQKAAELAAEAIGKQILEGSYAPGQRLPESELMTELGVGRSTVREAFWRLEAEGLIELRHQRGAFVTRLTRRGMADLFEIRESLEGLAAALAARNVGGHGHRAWLTGQRRLWLRRDVMQNELAHMDRNVPFHQGIIEMSGNERLIRTLHPLQVPGYRLRFLALLGERERRASAEDHVEIIDAILAGRAERAERCMRRHVRRAGELAQRIPGLA